MGKPGAQIVGCANLVFNRPTEERPKSTSTWRGRTHRPGSLQRQFVRSHPGEVDRERVHQVPHSQDLTLVKWTTRGCTKWTTRGSNTPPTVVYGQQSNQSEELAPG